MKGTKVAILVTQPCSFKRDRAQALRYKLVRVLTHSPTTYNSQLIVHTLVTPIPKKLVRRHKVGGTALTMCCNLKVQRLFSSLSREMLTFSRLIQHRYHRAAALHKHLKQSAEIVVVYNEFHYKWLPPPRASI